LNETYTELGATANDERDGIIELVIEGVVDTSLQGIYTITYIATDEASNNTNITRTVEVISKPFITTWRTDVYGGITSDDQIMITTSGEGYDYQVDWGDNTIDEHVSGDITHTYATVGTYTVTISGSFPQIYFPLAIDDGDGGALYYSDAHKLLSVEQWGDNQWRSMEKAFAGCESLVVNAIDTPDISEVTDMSWMFARAIIFNHDISHWDVSNVTNMSYMFQYTALFDQDLSSWDVSNVTNMEGMFSGGQGYWGYAHPSAFSKNINTWDVSNVTNMSYMFRGAGAFNGDLSNWDVSNVTDMSYMFWSVWRAETVFNRDISNWDVSNVTNMNGMFLNASRFEQNIGNWDVANVTNMDAMFKGVTLSTNNYDALLKGWSSLPLQDGINFSAGNSKYSISVQGYRDILTNNFDWTIIDGGID